LRWYPERHVILASYSQTKARDWVVKVKADIGAEELHSEVKGTSHFLTKQLGSLLCTGIGGMATGRGFDLGIIDDPHKNYQDANSPKKLKALYDWCKGTFWDRMEPQASLILVMHRWNERDLTQYMLDTWPGEQWDHIVLPALALPGDILGRAEGEALCPQRYDAEALQKLMAGDVVIAQAKYQQRVVAGTGNLWQAKWFKHWRLETLPDKFDVIILSWDMTLEATVGSWVVGQAWGMVGPDKYLLEQYRERVGFEASIAAVRMQRHKFPRASGILIERAVNGVPAMEVLKKTIAGIIPIKPVASKEARAMACVPEIAAGNVYIPDPVVFPWVRDYIAEVSAFPLGLNDDQVDTTSQALNYLRTFRRVRIGRVSKGGRQA
jgi:predicted phage terminase large subunit-like protein